MIHLFNALIQSKKWAVSVKVIIKRKHSGIPEWIIHIIIEYQLQKCIGISKYAVIIQITTKFDITTTLAVLPQIILQDKHSVIWMIQSYNW